jgi:CRP/FNR family transcriptional regulator, cyclic AMP receptor protein
VASIRVVQLLECEPGLAADLTSEELAIASQSIPVQVATLERGPWQPKSAAPEPGHLGFLVTKGVFVRRIQIGSGSSIELLGRGELLRPWQEDISSFCESSWEVVEPAALAQLGPRVARGLGQWPILVSNLVARAVRRSRAVAADAAVASIVGIEERLLRLLWQLGETFGRVEPDGVHLSVRLPHRLLAEMTGARRPSVTTALSNLQAEGKLVKAAEGCWILPGDPPA